MSEYEKLKQIIDEIDPLISSGITSSDIEFEAWQAKAELFVNRNFGSESLEYKKFKDISYYKVDFSELYSTGVYHNHSVDCQKGLQLAKAMLQTFLELIPDSRSFAKGKQQCFSLDNFQKVFIVHGHDGELKESVARIIEKQGIEAIILSEKVNQGRTIIEKFEEFSDVGGAICLFTADDIGNVKTASESNSRARQNVVFEAGYFMGKLGRDHTVILADPGVEMPSDLSGIVYTNTGNWQVEMLRELKAMGYTVDFNKLF